MPRADRGVMYYWLVMADSEPAVYVSAAAPSLTRSLAERARPNARLIALLSVGHFVIDLNQGSLTAILPFLKNAHHLSYAAAGTIVLASSMTSSIIQPLFGYWADQAARRWMLPLSVALSGLGLALTGVAPGYAALLALVLAMGLGVAAYHPEGYKTAASVAGARKTTAVSWFSVGGNIGIALGPPTITTLVTALGLSATLGMVGPSLMVAIVLTAALPRLVPTERAAAATRGADGAPNQPRAMALLVVVVTIRSWTQLGFTTFVPFYYVDRLKADPSIVGLLLFVFLGAGAVGTVVAGPLADRWGARPFIVWTFLGVAPLAALFLVVTGPLALVFLALMGGVLVSTFAASVVLAQQYLPRNAGMASGLIVGFASGTGGLGVTVLGLLADHYGLPAALWISAVMPLGGFIVAWFLPAPRAHA
jgi:MFS transporter, FSR family, fosmidomycin resistance protein